jgi:hypothetical protein
VGQIDLCVVAEVEVSSDLEEVGGVEGLVFAGGIFFGRDVSVDKVVWYFLGVWVRKDECG